MLGYGGDIPGKFAGKRKYPDYIRGTVRCKVAKTKLDPWIILEQKSPNPKNPRFKGLPIDVPNSAYLAKHPEKVAIYKPGMVKEWFCGIGN